MGAGGAALGNSVDVTQKITHRESDCARQQSHSGCPSNGNAVGVLQSACTPCPLENYSQRNRWLSVEGRLREAVYAQWNVIGHKKKREKEMLPFTHRAGPGGGRQRKRNNPEGAPCGIYTNEPADAVDGRLPRVAAR